MSKEIIQSTSIEEDNLKWQKEEKLLSGELDSQLSFVDHHMQIVAHPTSYNSSRFGNERSMIKRLEDSVEKYHGVSFPCPGFEPKNHDKNHIVVVAGALLEGQRHSALTLSAAGLVIYREELRIALDSVASVKPFFIRQILLTIYRVIRFLGRFFALIPGEERAGIKILITDTLNRVPLDNYQQLPIHDSYTLFYGSEPLTCPQLSIDDLEILREEVSGPLREVLSKIARRFCDQMNTVITEEQLMSEIEKIVKRN
jgi:hypothetical protein